MSPPDYDPDSGAFRVMPAAKRLPSIDKMLSMRLLRLV